MTSQTVRLAEIAARQETLQETLEGCDWCCGGGDDEWDALREEAAQLRMELAAGAPTPEWCTDSSVPAPNYIHFANDTWIRDDVPAEMWRVMLLASRAVV